MLISEGDNEPRWAPGERLHHLFEKRCDQLKKEGKQASLAISTEAYSKTFLQLESRANQLAHHLENLGVSSGDRVGLLFENSFEAYVTLLAILKTGAAYVPLDKNFPSDRISFILQDSEVKLVVSMSGYGEKLQAINSPIIFLDRDEKEIDRCKSSRLKRGDAGQQDDELAYIIYTSGTTGDPKGVAINHSSICNFVQVAAQTYGYEESDLVYQGMTLAFDFSVEELWVPLIVGAALVPAIPGASLVGHELHQYLRDNKVTALCCVPTLLATIENELPDLRLLLVSGEACPHNLVERWHQKGRTILNAYGPTETTVTATITELHPDHEVTIGKPLPSYTIVLLDPVEDKIVGCGDVGEIGIAGIGLARDYLHHPELTKEKFIPDFLKLENNPSKRIYRSGDLGRVTSSNEIEYLGRIDTQVKIRGYRIELTEIESAILKFPDIAQAVVDVYEDSFGVQELVAYYALGSGIESIDHDQLVETLRSKLPNYMVPSYYEHLEHIPLTPSNKADRKALLAPTSSRYAAHRSTYVAPVTENEKTFAQIFCSVMGLERASCAENFFTDLGAHSLLMARFCNELRAMNGRVSVSMRDVYKYPTIKDLSAFMEEKSRETTQQNVGHFEPQVQQHRPTRLQYYFCGALQLTTYAATGYLGLWAFLFLFLWIYEVADNGLVVYLRILASALGMLVGLTMFSVGAKWVLVGRWEKKNIPIWSFQYFKFWLAKYCIQLSPMASFLGTPIYNLYLRMLGAKVANSAVILSPASIGTDMLVVGENTLIKRKVHFSGYHAENNNIVLGSIELGDNVYVGSDSVLSIDTKIGNNGQLGHSSTLHAGEAIEPNQSYHGTPAVKTETDFREPDGLECSMKRRWLYSMSFFTYALFVGSFFGVIAIKILAFLASYFNFPELWTQGVSKNLYDVSFVIVGLVGLSLIAGILISLLFIRFLPKLLNRYLEPGKTYVRFGFHYYLQSTIAGLSNSKYLNSLFGDSSYIIAYLKWVGYRLNNVVQTGSNFGINHLHDNPFLVDIGSGSIVSDGLIMDNIQQSTHSFKLGVVKIGDQNYLGNDIYYPTTGRTGTNVLIATKTMIPIEGVVKNNIGLLGSPSFEIPRASSRDREIIDSITPENFPALLQNKNKYNLGTIALLLFTYWLYGSLAGVGGAMAIIYYPNYGLPSILLFGLVMSFFTMIYWPLIEKISLSFGTLESQTVSMYDPYFLFHERHWKFTIHGLDEMFSGTPFKSIMLRLLGVKVGKMVFDDGAMIVDRTLITIGDGVNMNKNSNIQGHSLEEGVFKSGEVTIGEYCTIAPGAFVHYSVEMGRNSTLGPNSFLMKGETTPTNSSWVGNPASMVVLKNTKALVDV